MSARAPTSMRGSTNGRLDSCRSSSFARCSTLTTAECAYLQDRPATYALALRRRDSGRGLAEMLGRNEFDQRSDDRSSEARPTRRFGLTAARRRCARRAARKRERPGQEVLRVQSDEQRSGCGHVSRDDAGKLLRSRRRADPGWPSRVAEKVGQLHEAASATATTNRNARTCGRRPRALLRTLYARAKLLS